MAVALVPSNGAIAVPAAGLVNEIVDGDTVVLDGGKQVRLVGIQAPKLPLGRPGFKAWPLAEEAKTALAQLVLGKEVALVYTGRDTDRHRRLLAHVEIPKDGGAPLWAQGEMLRRGLARVYSFADNRGRIADMLALEREARAAKRGIWGERFYRIREPEETRRHLDTFQLIEGEVVAAAIVRGRGYLNFGEDWRSDFTVTVAPRDRRTFERAGMDLEALAGKRIRVRGWLRWRNGPMIDATHPEQIEILP